MNISEHSGVFVPADDTRVENRPELTVNAECHLRLIQGDSEVCGADVRGGAPFEAADSFLGVLPGPDGNLFTGAGVALVLSVPVWVAIVAGTRWMLAL